MARHGYEVSPIDELISFEQSLLEPALKHLRQAVVKAKTVKEALSATEVFEEANPMYNKKIEFHKTNFLVTENIAIGQNPNLQDDFARMRSSGEFCHFKEKDSQIQQISIERKYPRMCSVEGVRAWETWKGIALSLLMFPMSEIQLPRVDIRVAPECTTPAGRAVILLVNVRIDVHQVANIVRGFPHLHENDHHLEEGIRILSHAQLSRDQTQYRHRHASGHGNPQRPSFPRPISPGKIIPVQLL